MKKETFYAVVIILLLLINLGTLGYLLMGKGDNHISKHGMPHKPGSMMAVELELDEAQKAQLDKIFIVHRKRMSSVDDRLDNAKKILLKQVKRIELDSNKTDSLLSIIGAVEIEKQTVIQKHFLEIRSILNDEQIERFNNLIDNISRRVGSHGPPHPRHGPHGGPPPRK